MLKTKKISRRACSKQRKFPYAHAQNKENIPTRMLKTKKILEMLWKGFQQQKVRVQTGG
jgi:hypothetical protein